MARTTRRSRRREKALVAGESRRKRRVPLWMGVLAGLAAGYGISKVAGGGSQQTLNDEFVASAERLAAPPPDPEPPDVPEPQPVPDLDLTAPPEPSQATEDLDAPDFGAPELDAPDLDAPDVMEEPSAPLSGRSLADEVRSHLSADPRTADLPGLAINVAEGTVFVRGSVPPGYEDLAIRDVISSVPGVNDVDLQVTTTS